METKYKIVETTGCTAFDLSINDKSVSDMSNEEQDKILEYLLTKVKEGISDNTIQLIDVIKLFQYDDYEYNDHICEQCGDTVSSTIWNI